MPKFHTGELVSCGYAFGTVITGRVVDVPRRSDGRLFQMVQIISGQRQGERSWPDRGWQLGVGPLEGTCERCSRAFRYQPGEVSHTCDSCWNGDAVARHRTPDRPMSSWERKQLRDGRRDRDKELVTT